MINTNILSIHWGFIPGGVAVYARHIEKVVSHGPLSIKSLCINSPVWPFDRENAAHMDMNIIEVRGRWDASWIRKVRYFIRKEPPDLIMTHGFNGAFVAAIASRGLNIPIVSSWHGDYYPSTFIQKIRKPFFDVLLKFLFRHIVKEIVTVSKFSKETLITKKINGKKVAVIHNGIPFEPLPPDDIQRVRDELGIPRECLLAGTACRFVVPKGLDCFLEAIAIVTKTVEKVRFVLWGDGPQRAYLEGLIKELHIDEYVIMPGYRSDITHSLNALDIFVMSSYAENFSIALLEAMRAGLPIVATNVGGNPEAIEGGAEGILVPAADRNALATGIITLANDHQLREQIALKARERFLEQFTSDKMVEKTAAWLLECIEKHKIKSALPN
jgi:glycosyltransferase involved in cell wall biosynthesis